MFTQPAKNSSSKLKKQPKTQRKKFESAQKPTASENSVIYVEEAVQKGNSEISPLPTIKIDIFGRFGNGTKTV